MSQPRRRRRRRRKPASEAAGRTSERRPERTAESPESAAQSNQPADEATSSRRGRSRRRRGSGVRQPASAAKSSEDLVRALPKERPEALTAPPDGQLLEDLIGDLQSEWGVPQYPQEFRITVKIADERDARPDRGSVIRPSARSQDEPAPANGAGPKREKAPAAPRLAASEPVESERSPRRRRRSRRRRGRGGEASG